MNETRATRRTSGSALMSASIGSNAGAEGDAALPEPSAEASPEDVCGAGVERAERFVAAERSVPSRDAATPRADGSCRLDGRSASAAPALWRLPRRLRDARG